MAHMSCVEPRKNTVTLVYESRYFHSYITSRFTNTGHQLTEKLIGVQEFWTALGLKDEPTV